MIEWTKHEQDRHVLICLSSYLQVLIFFFLCLNSIQVYKTISLSRNPTLTSQVTSKDRKMIEILKIKLQLSTKKINILNWYTKELKLLWLTIAVLYNLLKQWEGLGIWLWTHGKVQKTGLYFFILNLINDD